MQNLRRIWKEVQGTYWFLPSLMTALAIVLGLGMVRVDESVQEHWVIGTNWVYGGSPDGARQVLSTVAGSMVTVAGTVFSVTVVALSLASNQFGPRLLRNFMRDRGNQIVLGTFIATFAYCIVVLRTVRGEDGSDFVPHFAVTGAVALALASVGVLIYFIHHAAVSVQAPVVIANVGQELKEGILEMFPEELGDDPAELAENDTSYALPEDFDLAARPIRASRDGYVEMIDGDTLMKLAAEKDLLVRVVHRPGHFVVKRDVLAQVWPDLGEELDEAVQDAFAIGQQKTQFQDAEFAVEQLVEVAVRALSPGVNDPFTAVSCVDYLGAALCRLANRRIPSRYRFDEEGRLRVVADALDFPAMADTAFRQIRQSGRSSVPVVVRMMDIMTIVMRHTRRKRDRDALLHHAEMIRRCGQDWPEECDRQDLDERYKQVRDAYDSARRDRAAAR